MTKITNDSSSWGRVPIERLRPGLQVLWQAYTYAVDVGRSPWDFALEVDQLYRSGLGNTDLRWLVAKGFTEHGKENSVYGDRSRSFLPSRGFQFVNETCFILTKKGVSLVSDVLGASPSPLRAEDAAIPNAPFVPNSSALTRCGPLSELRPHWDSDRRELSLADRVVKRFRVPARNQEIILCTFEEEDWPPHIDDPLPMSGDIVPKTRLHDTINRLNGKQVNLAIRFHGNGNGNGILWKLHQPS